MDLSKINDIKISTFINPHLFWIILKNEERGKLLDSVNKQMQECVALISNSSNNFESGEIVAAQIDNKLYRAIIEDIIPQKFSKPLYLLWLIDHGTMRETSCIFKLPSKARKSPPLALQASLNNVKYIEQILDYDSMGQLTNTNKSIPNPTPTCREEAMNILFNGHDFKFSFENREGGIVFGDILFKNKENEETSLKDCLINAGVIVESSFEGVTDFINDYKESHRMIISKICHKEPYLLETEINKNVEASCMSIVSKILEEFQYSDVLSFEDEMSEPLWRNKSKNTNTSLDSTMSDNESGKEKKSKRTRLLEKLSQHQSASKLNESITSVSTDETIDDQIISDQNPKSVSKIKQFCEQMKNHKNIKPKYNSELELAKKGKIIFGPAGSERTHLSFNKKKCIPKTEQSSDESSCSRSHSEKNLSINKNYSRGITPPKKMSPVELKNCPKEVTQSSTEEEVGLTDAECNSSKEDSSLSDMNTLNSNAECQNDQPVQTMKIKPHCSCKQCSIWTKEENVFLENMDGDTKVARIENVKAQLLFKENKNVESSLNICSIDYASMKKVEKQSIQKVLAHSEIVLSPIFETSKLAFHKNIHVNLNNLQYKQAKRIQAYAWPAILRNQHVFMIHGPRTGKSMAYMPVMLTFVLEKYDRYHSLIKVAGAPIVIILCGNTDKCEQLWDLAKLLMGNKKSNISLVTYPFEHVNTSHTDMLITTPEILIDLLKNNFINFKRLCHLIIEDGDTVLTKYNDTMSAIFELAQSMLKNRLSSKPLQLIVCAEHWNSQMKYLMDNLQQVPLVCIGNPLEAALYGQVEIYMKFSNSVLKEQNLKQLLKETHRIYRSIIICKEKEINEIVEMLGLRGIDYIAVFSTMNVEDILHLEDVWTQAKGGSYSVLICSDFVLNTILSVTCAEVLIHYSLPSTWTKFLKRFSCLLENCKSPLSSKSVNYFAKSIILYDECSNDPVKKFINYVASTDLKKRFPSVLLKYSEDLKRAEEEEKLKQDIGFCENLKLFGDCAKADCLKRHIINPDLDVSNYLPKFGKIKFKIVNIIDVSIFSIQLLQYVDNDNKVQEFDEISDVTEDLTATLTLSKKKVHDPVLGRRYAFYNIDEQDTNYYRCEVLEIKNEHVKIKLLDKGTIIQSIITRLYWLPSEFDIHVKPRQIIDCYLANCIPPYRDENFSAKSFFNLKVLLESKDYKNIIFTGEIHLQLNQTLWLKDVYEEVVLLDRTIPRFQLSRETIVQKLVNPKSNQLNNLYKLCTEAGINLPTYSKPTVSVPFRKQEVKKCWAHLDMEQVNEVTFAAAFSPDEVFVRLNKFSDLLFNLQKEIQRSIEKPNYPKLHEVTEGDVYLAKDPNGPEYNRVLALKVEKEQVLCFYVDFGDEAVINVEDLKHIQDIYITKLPFQCIKCRLYGIQPIENEWNENVTVTLYNYAYEPNTDIFRSLYLKVCKKEVSSSITPTMYSVLLKDGLNEKKTLINQILIECGMVVPNSEENLEDFDIPVQQQELSDLDEDLKEAAYICRKTEELDQNYQGNASEELENKHDYNPEDMELFIFGDPFEFWMHLVSGEELPTVTRTNELPAITAGPMTDYCTPDVYWSQTESTVKLSIRLTDIEDYKLTLSKGRIFHFKTIKNDKTYWLKLMLYQVVENLKQTSLGPEIRIIMTKSKPIDWPRLILSKQKARNIHYDVTKLCTEDYNDNKKVLQMPKELADDFDELNEDDPMYTVYSDMDSDLDVELNNSD